MRLRFIRLLHGCCQALLGFYVGVFLDWFCFRILNNIQFLDCPVVKTIELNFIDRYLFAVVTVELSFHHYIELIDSDYRTVSLGLMTFWSNAIVSRMLANFLLILLRIKDSNLKLVRLAKKAQLLSHQFYLRFILAKLFNFKIIIIKLSHCIDCIGKVNNDHQSFPFIICSASRRFCSEYGMAFSSDERQDSHAGKSISSSYLDA